MPTLETTVFENDSRAVVHLRAQRIRHRLGLIFGSGTSKDLNFPDWPTLVKRIAAHPQIKATELIDKCSKEGGSAAAVNRTNAALTQLIFSEFWRGRVAELGVTRPLTFLEEQKITSEWLKLIHSELYRDCTEDEREQKLKEHPYLQDFQSIIKSSPLTINYNFDDTLEKLLMGSRSQEESSKTRGYEVTDRPDRQFQKDCSIIYHPNGYIPYNFSDGTSPEVVFADEAFQDQLISAATGRYVHLSNHLFSNTCLLIGLSLDDTTLQSMLRQNAVNNPGNVHYIVHYIADETALEVDVRSSIFRANFQSYNLYTLFLTKQQIGALARLISMDPNNFRLDYEDRKPKYVYYLIGAVGAGKSTAAANFRNLQTYDEWIDPRKEALARPESEVEEQAPEIDAWIREQFRKKNYALTQSSEGIHLIDRCPLDPLTFGKKDKLQEKALKLIEAITNRGTRKVEAGHIIYLECGLEDVRVRNSFKHKYWPDVEFQDLIDRIEQIYGPIDKMTRICTRGRSARAVAHEIAKTIFTDEYRPVEIQNRLKQVSEEAAS